MGRKGVSKRKPKGSKSFSNDNVKGSSSARPDAGSLVQNLVKGNGAAFNKGGINPSDGSNKKNKNGK